MVAGPLAAGVAQGTATAAGTGALRRVTRPFSNRQIKSPKLGGVDIAMIVATTAIGVVVSWVGTGRWERLKRAYTQNNTGNIGKPDGGTGTGGSSDARPTQGGDAPALGPDPAPLDFNQPKPSGWPWE